MIDREEARHLMAQIKERGLPGGFDPPLIGLDGIPHERPLTAVEVQEIAEVAASAPETSFPRTDVVHDVRQETTEEDV